MRRLVGPSAVAPASAPASEVLHTADSCGGDCCSQSTRNMAVNFDAGAKRFPRSYSQILPLHHLFLHVCFHSSGPGCVLPGPDRPYHVRDRRLALYRCRDLGLDLLVGSYSWAAHRSQQLLAAAEVVVGT